MDRISSESKKEGSIEIIFICFLVIFFMFIYFFIYFLYSKININVYRVKQDLFNIVQSAVLAFNKEELVYNNFEIDEALLIQKINNLIELSYDNVKLNYLSYNKKEKKVYITVEIDLNLDKWNIKDKVIIRESIKLNMMEFNDEFE